jgi:chaperonin GroEL
MKKKIITGDKAKEELLEGAKLLYDAVSTTLGPLGQNAVIEAFGEPIVTHDGVTVAKSIEDILDASSGARVGVEMIKASSSKTNDNVGDGTTSSTILTYHLMNGGLELIKKGYNGMKLRRELEVASTEALAILDQVTEPITTEKATIEIAKISSEDPIVGEQVGKMYHELGKDAVVAVEIGTKANTEYKVIKGYHLDRGLLDPSMITDTRTQTANIDNPLILLVDGVVGSSDITNIFAEIYENGHDSVVVVADDFKKDLLEATYRQRGSFDIIGIKAPGFGDQRKELLLDLAAILGAKLTNPSVQSFEYSDLGTCDNLIASPKEVVITGLSDVKERVTELENRLEKTTGEFDKKKIEKRIAALNAKVGEISVGGNTEMEVEERKYLIDDAVAAVEAALRDGIVPGGGTTYLHIANRLQGLSEGHKLLQAALLEPFKVLMTNAGERAGLRLKELTDGQAWFGTGYDIMGTMEIVDLKEHGVIDPAMVIKQAITNAVSVAGSALTTGVIITNEKEKDDGKEEE